MEHALARAVVLGGNGALRAKDESAHALAGLAVAVCGPREMADDAAAAVASVDRLRAAQVGGGRACRGGVWVVVLRWRCVLYDDGVVEDPMEFLVVCVPGAHRSFSLTVFSRFRSLSCLLAGCPARQTKSVARHALARRPRRAR